jgi:hypothetical protein
MEQLVLDCYGLHVLNTEVIKSGLINDTWKIVTSGEEKAYVVQRVNRGVFPDPAVIDQNSRSLKSYFDEVHPNYLFVAPIAGLDGKTMYNDYRLFPYIEDSISLHTCQTAQQAFEAASQFSKFTFKLKDYDVHKLCIPLPHFHDLAYRYDQLLAAMRNPLHQGRIGSCRDILMWAIGEAAIIDRYKV